MLRFCWLCGTVLQFCSGNSALKWATMVKPGGRSLRQIWIWVMLCYWASVQGHNKHHGQAVGWFINVLGHRTSSAGDWWSCLWSYHQICNIAYCRTDLVNLNMWWGQDGNLAEAPVCDIFSPPPEEFPIYPGGGLAGIRVGHQVIYQIGRAVNTEWLIVATSSVRSTECEPYLTLSEHDDMHFLFSLIVWQSAKGSYHCCAVAVLDQF